MQFRKILAAAAFGAALLAGPALADSVKIANVVELTGGGATVGNNWKDAVTMAFEEINAAGGILGKTIEVTHYDTQTNAQTSRAMVQKALDENVYVVLGPIYSSSTKVNMILTQRAEVPQIVGSEAPFITTAGNKYVFRTSFGAAQSMPKLANYLRDNVKAKSVAVIWVNDDFGKGGRDSVVKELKARSISVAADISSEVGQADFASDVIKLKGSGADAIFAYLHEEESARLLKELRKQGVTQPTVGETTLMNQKVIDLAGEAANGAKGHVGLSADAPVPAVQAFAAKFQKKYGYKPDHNGIKGYLAAYTVKEITERTGKFDSKAFAKALHGATITPKDEPGILMEVTWDDKGDIDRQSFLVEVVDGKQKITEILPKLGN